MICLSNETSTTNNPVHNMCVCGRVVYHHLLNAKRKLVCFFAYNPLFIFPFPQTTNLSESFLVEWKLCLCLRVLRHGWKKLLSVIPSQFGSSREGTTTRRKFFIRLLPCLLSTWAVVIMVGMAMGWWTNPEGLLIEEPWRPGCCCWSCWWWCTSCCCCWSVGPWEVNRCPAGITLKKFVGSTVAICWNWGMPPIAWSAWTDVGPGGSIPLDS